MLDELASGAECLLVLGLASADLPSFEEAGVRLKQSTRWPLGSDLALLLSLLLGAREPNRLGRGKFRLGLAMEMLRRPLFWAEGEIVLASVSCSTGGRSKIPSEKLLRLSLPSLALALAHAAALRRPSEAGAYERLRVGGGAEVFAPAPTEAVQVPRPR